jgi:hypothetical protein
VTRLADDILRIFSFYRPAHGRASTQSEHRMDFSTPYVQSMPNANAANRAARSGSSCAHMTGGFRGTSDMLEVVESEPRQQGAFRADVLAGMSERQKSVPSRWLYDRRGSELFEEITGLDEYYLTRTETAILRRHGKEMGALCGEDIVLLEYGAGAGLKFEILVNALNGPRMYVPIDIAGDFLKQTVARMREQFPGSRRDRSSPILRPTLIFLQTFLRVVASRSSWDPRLAISTGQESQDSFARCAGTSACTARPSSGSIFVRTSRR